MCAFNRLIAIGSCGLVLSLLTVSVAMATGKKFDGTAKNKNPGPNQNNTCTTMWEYDTANNGKVFLSWDCAVALGLGTINDHGTPGDDTDDTFDAAAGTAMGNTNNGQITFWIFTMIEVCAKGDPFGDPPASPDCCLNQTVWVVKDQATGQNSMFIQCGLLSAKWIRDVKSCSKNGAKTLVAKWNGTGVWDLVPPKTPTHNQADPASGSVKRVLDIAVTGPSGKTVVPMIVGTLSAWTILPQFVADEIGLVPEGPPVDLTGTSTLRGLGAASMNGSGQVLYNVAPLDGLSNGISPTSSGSVLISNSVNSAFGVLGGEFMDTLAYAKDPASEDDILASDALPPSTIPTVSEWGLIVLALLLLTAGTIIFGRRRRPAVA